MQILLSLPANLVTHFAELEAKPLPAWVPGCDPPGCQLGSGGATANLLVQAWQKTGAGLGFPQWLRASKKLLMHSGGQSRRLPAYAATGKILLPLPVLRWAGGQRLDQTLLDLQLPLCRKILAQAPSATAAMVTCGDVLLRSTGPLPPLPDVDVVCLGLWVAPETATGHGVFFCSRSSPHSLSFFLHKPSSERIRQLATEHLFLIDTGIWLLSEKAVRVVMERAGWNWDGARFANGMPRPYNLYAEFGLALGTSPVSPDAAISGLSSAVVPLPQGDFYHFGTSRELVSSCLRLQNLVLDQRELGANTLKPHPEMFVQNTRLGLRLRPEHQTLWVENAALPARWTLAAEHVLTGIPENDWALRLPRGVCLDLVPIGDSGYGVRIYGLDDAFRGRMGDSRTTWCGAAAKVWLEQRGLRWEDAGFTPDTDIQEAALFPVLGTGDLKEGFLQWLLDAEPTGASPHDARRWLDGPRLSANQLSEQANLTRLYEQRRHYQSESLLALARNSAHSVFYHLDLARTAAAYAQSNHPLPQAEPASAPLMRRVHHRMFSATVRRLRKEKRWEADENEAFRLLQDAVVRSVRQRPMRPARRLLDDQIIWGRCPVRLDLAGGWTDTPPYCLIYGGKVVNVAVNLNGQSPVQAFVKLSKEPRIVLRSIDLGVEERITSYADLRKYGEVGSGFSVAKAALALAGFLPEFGAEPAPTSLKNQLETFGGGIEISLLAAVPKGSGLGTSSILAATLLGTLGDLCDLGWDQAEICRRTLALEQLLTTGGGWQDQVGGLTRGLKLIDTQPGLDQSPVIRWLPAHLFTDPAPRSCMLLYYTGITRVAKSILKEIVRGMFLNASEHLGVLTELGEHALVTYEVLLRGQWTGLCECLRRSWELNQRLDSGTNPPEVQAILDRIDDYLAATKLLGAGGGGYLLMLAKDQAAAVQIRRTLEASPLGRQARFVDFSVSETGLEITRS
ncbi:MAG: bifunctional fucokinase/fucose-1-phosphate guanylyltransferase [Planctomycetota bacterium]|nr:bifunctional fucokinase/fucose-1-phosphate guanylyltransferase [Planctomycetota bacterium]